jgi:hypothetical protein
MAGLREGVEGGEGGEAFAFEHRWPCTRQLEDKAAGGERWSCRGVGAGGEEVKVIAGQLQEG